MFLLFVRNEGSEMANKIKVTFYPTPISPTPPTCSATYLPLQPKLLITLREDFHKCLMTLGTTDALKMCCSFNFLSFRLFSSLAQPRARVSQRLPKGAESIVWLWYCAFTNVPMLIEQMIALLSPPTQASLMNITCAADHVSHKLFVRLCFRRCLVASAQPVNQGGGNG